MLHVASAKIRRLECPSDRATQRPSVTLVAKTEPPMEQIEVEFIQSTQHVYLLGVKLGDEQTKKSLFDITVGKT